MTKPSIEDVAALCKEYGLRLTSPRRIIFHVLASSTDHPDVVELHRRVCEYDSTISVATVYRTLNILREKGILERHTFANGRARFETTDRDHHDHFIDVTTGKVIEFRSDEIERLQEEIARQYGFRIVSHKLEIYVEPLREESRSTKTLKRVKPWPP